ncbi:FAD/NAD(P)-binding oxidoreductase [Phycicoccus elongatus]|jgi:NADPH-dependent 2,4-dienoyl-CoA reductase/sulfur reductase-like enzyme|uniref:FAD/NAD(P)-binding oxidoreductase n=1 Tax=Phycicoccus elongatus TaxID=101689 RepID=UPI002B648681|nr:FAD/NAD(P)-binding oxidoreductase [Phycicoccus elongatus]MCA0323196.1 NAD(P)/FAD-dependent oxidoreductase [Actinomycetota bacterium]HPF75728.1 FAD/NAD(P)-binding oxidoreductase [Phycicoccus elongatus]HPQ73716.1 FAD/NAD(P)-binding oxidoreductase [Phycicoccus elongatus]
MRSDLVVIGGGPAGMAAAATALAGGLRVTLLDSGRTLGGQYWRHPAPGSVPTGDHLHHDLTTYRALVDVLDAHRVAGTLDLLLSHHVWTAVADEDGFAVHVLDRSGTAGSEVAEVIRGRQLVIATGAFDRQLPFPGWDLPGVFTAGGLQALLKGNGVAAGSRVVVAGTGPFLLPVATAVADSGARVLAVCEANSPTRWGRRVGAVVRSPAKAIEGAGYAVALARHRIPVRTSTVVVAAHGQARLEAVTLAAVDGVGRVRPGTERRVVVDALGVGWGFVPQLDLAITLGCRLLEWVDGNHVAEVDAGQRSSVAGVLVAGELTGIGGAALALREGQLAGESVLADAGRPPATAPARLVQVRREVERLRAFARAMAEAHPVPQAWTTWVQDDTIACRCEEVPAGRVRAAVAAGASDARQVKQLTRAGMGWCQGRMCGYAATCLAHEGPDGPGDRRPVDGGPTAYAPVERLVATPIPLGALAAAEFEAKGNSAM